MSQPRLSPLQSRLLALGIALLLLLGLFLGLYRPLSGVREAAAERLQSLEFRLDKYRQLSARREALEQRYLELKGQGAADQAFLNQRSEALAVAALQQLVKQQVVRSGGELSRLQVNQSRQEAQYQRISINVHLESSVEGLAKLLYGLEQGPPALFVDQLMVRALNGAATPKGTTPRELDVSFDLTGYLRGEAL